MAACLVAALVSFVQAVKPSPCPEQFQYEGGEQGQQWEGTLKLATDDELQGLWIRVKFDTTVKEIVLPVSIFFQRSGSFHSKKRAPATKECLWSVLFQKVFRNFADMFFFCIVFLKCLFTI